MVVAHQRGVYAFALQLTGNHEDAEDLSQDVFIQAHRMLGTFRGDGSIRGWLLRIAANRFLSSRRKKSLAFTPNLDLEEHAAPADAAAPDEDAQAGAIRQEVARALEALSPQERTAFALRFQNDFAVKGIAETMGVAEGTVKSLLFRSIQKLRGRLGHLVADLSS